MYRQRWFQYIKGPLLLTYGACILWVGLAGCARSSDDAKPPGGISNVGNTCYINATLQALAAFYPNMFTPHKAITGANKKLAGIGRKVINTINSGNTVEAEQAKAFFVALQAVHNTEHRKEAGKENHNNDLIELGKQGDAQEMLTTIFDALQFPQAATNSFIIHPTTNEKKKVASPDPWSVLKLNLLPNKDLKFPSEIGMQELLAAQFNPELLEGYTWNEGDSNSKVDTKKANLLAKLPMLANGILPIYIARYTSNAEKVETKIKNSFSLTLKKEYLEGGKEDISYSLKGFIIHQINPLHYVAWIYNENERQWYYISDSYVAKKTITEADNASQNAYLFFYQPS